MQICTISQKAPWLWPLSDAALVDRADANRLDSAPRGFACPPRYGLAGNAGVDYKSRVARSGQPRTTGGGKAQSTARPRGLTISELAKVSGISMSTIKYYLREGLLPQGDLAAQSRQYYGQRHLDRLAVIRALRETADLPIEMVRQLVGVLDKGTIPTFDLVAMAIDALGRHRGRETATERAVKQELLELLATRRIRVRPLSGALRDLTASVVMLRRFSPGLRVKQLIPYLEYALSLAEMEVTANADNVLSNPDRALSTAVLGTALWEPLIVATRRIASEHFAGPIFSRAAKPPAKNSSRTSKQRAKRPDTHRQRSVGVRKPRSVP
ncbi:MAG: MerR family transcriptional regulator [Polyangiaceae bacterium]